jgi:hypothetical protein
MKERSMQRTRLLAAGALTVALTLAWMLSPASALAGARAPATPGPGASMATWQRWAAAERLAVRGTNWAAVVRGDGCALEHVVIRPVTHSEAAGIPRGVVADAVVVTATCGQAQKAAHRPDVPAISSYCVGMTNCTTKSITDGVAAVGTVTVDGNPNYMGAEYTYTKSSGSTTGHVELGNDSLGSGCGVGTKVANGKSTKLTHDHGELVVWGPRNFSATWSGTWWQHNSNGSYTRFGTVCGDY